MIAFKIILCLAEVVEGIDVDGTEDVVDDHGEGIGGHDGFGKEGVAAGDVEETVLVVPGFHILTALPKVVVDGDEMTVDDAALLTQDSVDGKEAGGKAILDHGNGLTQHTVGTEGIGGLEVDHIVEVDTLTFEPLGGVTKGSSGGGVIGGEFGRTGDNVGTVELGDAGYLVVVGRDVDGNTGELALGIEDGIGNEGLATEVGNILSWQAFGAASGGNDGDVFHGMTGEGLREG